MRYPVLSVILAAVALAAAGPAQGAVRVDSAPGLGAFLDHQPDSDGWRVIIEHFSDSSRNGFRARQIGFGDPTIFESSNQCSGNSVFNDVVCNSIPETIQMSTGAVTNARNELAVGGSNGPCQEVTVGTGTAGEQTVVILDLRGGDDIVRPLFGCGGQENVAGNHLLAPQFLGGGGAGNDSITGGRLNDSFRGDSGNDRLSGASGDDELVGNDGADVIDGGPGTDTVKYEGSSPVTVRLDGSANDGRSGEGDNVVGTEVVISGAGNDTLTGSSAANTLDGGAGNDQITGGNGADTLRGEDGDDLIDARDNASTDVVRCGNGVDNVIADLQDSVQILAAVPPQPKAGGSACERVERFAVDDGPPAQVVTKRVTIAATGSLSVRLRCPRRARVTCRGKIRLVDASSPRRTLASAVYVAERGHRSSPVRLRLSKSEARRIRARGVVTTVTREHGVSKKGPRSAINTLGVRRGT